jgi:DNA-binding SARP family transcriptional activator
VGQTLQIYLLGRFAVSLDGEPLPASAWRRRRPADLLKLLALTPGHALPREAVFDALWPDKDPPAAANNLHRALYDLRHVLGSRWVEAARGRVALRGDTWVDAAAFERAVRQGGDEALKAAVALYPGDLSPEDPASPWLQQPRRRLRALFVEAAHAVARQPGPAGEAAARIALLRRLLQAEPASEDAHQLLMRLLAEEGRPAEALRQFEACAAARRAAGLGAPSLATEALRDAIVAGELGPLPRSDAGTGYHRAAQQLLGRERRRPLRGREGVVAFLDSVLQRGHGLVVLLGEQGAGTTRVALEGARLAEARGAAVLCAVARPGASPGALLAELLQPAERARSVSLQAVEAALQGAGGGRPIYLLLDELHLADAASLALLLALARQAEALRLVVVATCREEAIHAGTPIQLLLADLDAERLARGLHVPRLSSSGTLAMLCDLIDEAPSPALATAVYQATDGLPARIEAVMAAWRASGQVPEAREPVPGGLHGA